MDKTESIVTVDDAVKKLILLDSKDKIWTQEMLLQVTDKAVRLLDCDTQVGHHIWLADLVFGTAAAKKTNGKMKICL